MQVFFEPRFHSSSLFFCLILLIKAIHMANANVMAQRSKNMTLFQDPFCRRMIDHMANSTDQEEVKN